MRLIGWKTDSLYHIKIKISENNLIEKCKSQKIHSLPLQFRPKEIEIREIRDERLEVAMRERERERERENIWLEREWVKSNSNWQFDLLEREKEGKNNWWERGRD